jgi:hypothetical protein
MYRQENIFFNFLAFGGKMLNFRALKLNFFFRKIYFKNFSEFLILKMTKNGIKLKQIFWKKIKWQEIFTVDFY